MVRSNASFRKFIEGYNPGRYLRLKQSPIVASVKRPYMAFVIRQWDPTQCEEELWLAVHFSQ